MIDHIWTVVCSRVVVDRESNNVSIQNVLEQLNIMGEPKPDGMLPINVEIVSLWVRSDLDVPGRGRSRLTFLFPSGKRIEVSGELNVNLSESRRGRTIMKLQGFPIRESGQHALCVEFQNEGEAEWHQVAAIPVEVIFEPPEPEQVTNEK